jgi:hypothetical protein
LPQRYDDASSFFGSGAKGGYLRKRHHAKLFAATKLPDAKISAIPRDDPLETGPWDEIHYLRKQRPPSVHDKASRPTSRENYSQIVKPISNRHQAKSRATYWPIIKISSIRRA